MECKDRGLSPLRVLDYYPNQLNRVGAVDAEVLTVRSLAIVEAQVLRQSEEAVLEPALADLLVAPVLETEHVLTDHRMLVAGALEPVQPAVTDVARRGADGVRLYTAHRAVVACLVQATDDDVRRVARGTNVARGRGPHRCNQQQQCDGTEADRRSVLGRMLTVEIHGLPSLSYLIVPMAER